MQKLSQRARGSFFSVDLLVNAAESFQLAAKFVNEGAQFSSLITFAQYGRYNSACQSRALL